MHVWPLAPCVHTPFFLFFSSMSSSVCLLCTLSFSFSLFLSLVRTLSLFLISFIFVLFLSLLFQVQFIFCWLYLNAFLRICVFFVITFLVSLRCNYIISLCVCASPFFSLTLSVLVSLTVSPHNLHSSLCLHANWHTFHGTKGTKFPKVIGQPLPQVFACIPSFFSFVLSTLLSLLLLWHWVFVNKDIYMCGYS